MKPIDPDKDIDFDVGDDPTDPDVIAYWSDVAARIRMALLPRELESWADAIESRIKVFEQAEAALAQALEEYERAGDAQSEQMQVTFGHVIALQRLLRRTPGKTLEELLLALSGMALERLFSAGDIPERARCLTEFAARLATQDVPEEALEPARQAAVSLHLEVAREAEANAALARLTAAEHESVMAKIEFPRLKWKLSADFGRAYGLDSPAIKALFGRRGRAVN